MGLNKTKIPWVKNPDGTQGYTWNVITGCLNHINGMCKGGNFPCYAYRLATTRLKDRYLANKNVAPVIKREGGRTYRMGFGLGEGKTRMVSIESARNDPFYPRFWEDRECEPIRRNIYGGHKRKARGIFICDMSDLFGIGIPEVWTRRILTTIECCPLDRFYLLTKQPQNLSKFSPFPENCYVGVSVTDFSSLYYAVQYLYDIEAKVKYLSTEPLLASLAGDSLVLSTQFVNRVIIGAQTKPTVMPKIEWVQEIVESCDTAGVKVFLKDSLKPLIDKSPNIVGLTQYGSAKLRQEMPK